MKVNYLRREKNEKQKRKRKNKTNREFAIVTYCYLAIFLALIGYIVYFQAFKAESFINNPYNKQQDLFEDSIIRGRITSAEGNTLAKTKVSSSGKERRVYPYNNIQIYHLLSSR